MSRDLTKKQKEFADDYIESGNGVSSALKAYDTNDYSTAGVIAHENLKKPKIISYLEEMLPETLLAEVHREGLYATKTVFNKDGEVLAEDADFLARAKYLDMAYKILGKYAPTKALHGHVDLNQRQPSQKIIDLANKLNA